MVNADRTFLRGVNPHTSELNTKGNTMHKAHGTTPASQAADSLTTHITRLPSMHQEDEKSE